MSNLNLKSAGGGGVILTPASTAVDLTLTIPATSSTLLTQADGASNAVYTPAGTGAVATTVQNALRSMFVSSVLALKAIAKGTSPYVTTTGYYASGDGGGAMFYYDSTDTSSANNGGTVIVANDGGRWKMARSGGRLDVRTFGAKLDGITDIGGTINSILGVGATAFIPYSTAGCVINTTVTISSGQWVEFENPSVLVKSTSNTAIFRILGTSNTELNPCGVRGGAIFNMAGSGVNSSVFLMGTATQNVVNVRLLGKFTCYNCYSAYLEETHATNYVVDIVIEDVYCQYTLGRQFYSKRSRGFFRVGKFAVDHTANTYVTTWEGIRVTDFIGFEGDKLDVLGPVPAQLTPVYQSGANSMVFGGQTGGGKSSLFLSQALVDNTYGNGIVIDNILNVECRMLAAYQNLGFGIQITNCNNIQIDKILEVGASGVTGASAAQVGVLIQGCSDVQINNMVANFNTGPGVYVNNSSIGTYSNVQTKSNLAAGWAESGTSNSNLKIGLTSYGNSSSSLVQVGPSSACCNWLPASGIFRASDVGAITV